MRPLTERVWEHILEVVSDFVHEDLTEVQTFDPLAKDVTRPFWVPRFSDKELMSEQDDSPFYGSYIGSPVYREIVRVTGALNRTNVYDLLDRDSQHAREE